MKKTNSTPPHSAANFSKTCDQERWYPASVAKNPQDEKPQSFHVPAKYLSKGVTILCILALMSLTTYGQRVTISGYIQDAGTKEALIGANIYETRLHQGTSTNQYGFYSITLPAADTLILIFSFIGYK